MKLLKILLQVALILYSCNAFLPTQTCSLRQKTHYVESSATPLDPADWPERFPAKKHCSKCGLCETSFVSQVIDSCAFLGEGMRRMDDAEKRVHGRTRDVKSAVWSAGQEGDSIAEEGKNNCCFRFENDLCT